MNLIWLRSALLCGMCGLSLPGCMLHHDEAVAHLPAAMSSAAPFSPTHPGSCGMGTGNEQYLLIYQSALSRWCVASEMLTSHEAEFPPYFAFGDSVVAFLNTLFAVTPPGLPFTFEAQPQFGGAYTGTDFGTGISVTGDAYYASNVYGGVPGFWGYLFSLHEAIDVWTGTVSPNWPIDWWADHRSPFPNSMDYHILKTIGMVNQNQTLLQAADVQHMRFSVSYSPNYDSEVSMFDSLFDSYGGFPAFANVFRLIQEDGVKWPEVASDPSALLSEYVIAYLQLGLRVPQDLTASLFTAQGIGTKDTQTPPYSVDPNIVRAVADTHCSLRAASSAGFDTRTAFAALRSGKYQDARVSPAAQTTCPSECIWSVPRNTCVAPW